MQIERKWARIARIGASGTAVAYTPEGDKVCVPKDQRQLIGDLEVGDIFSFVPHPPPPLPPGARPITQPTKYFAGSPRIIGYSVEEPQNTAQKVGQEDGTRRCDV
jgi:hypothetical protein